MKNNRLRWDSARYDCFWVLALIVAVSYVSGCGGESKSAASVSPSDAAASAMALYDKDASGTLDQSELAASPGLLAARDRYDTDVSGLISEEEIAARLEQLFASGARWLSVNCQVLKAGRPLAGATVRFVPESYFEDSLQPATGTTDSHGYASPAVAAEHHPEDLKGLNIMQAGVYRVEVEHPSITQPHKPLGCEIDEFSRGGTEPVFRL